MNTIQESIDPAAELIAGTSIDLSEKDADEIFHSSEIITVAAAHGAHDTYFSYLPTILPLLIQNLALNTTQAGMLSAFTQIPNLIQPVIGHLADRKNLKLLVILAPTLSGIFITLVGVAPNFGTAAVLLLLAGFSTAGFHAIAPAMVSARSGRLVGRGMGFFMVGGELGFGLGPLVVVAVLGVFTLTGLPWLMILGMLVSVILYYRLKNVSTVRSAHLEAGLPARQALLEMRGLLLPIMAIIFVTGFLNANLVNFLPTFMVGEGAGFAVGGIYLALVELSGTIGVFFMGMYSDRLGHRTIALVGTVASVVFSLCFLAVSGWLQIVFLMCIGMTAFVANPAYLSMIQTRFSRNRSLSNGVYMSSSFILRSIVVVLVGIMADLLGMRTAFTISILLALLSIPFIFMLPKR